MAFNNPIPERKDPKLRPAKDSGGLQTLVQAEKLMQIAILLPSAAFVGWLFGTWADRAFHTSWLAIAGIALGGVAGLVYVVRLVLATGDEKSGKGPIA